MPAISAQIEESNVVVLGKRQVDGFVIWGVEVPRTIAIFDTPCLNGEWRHEVGLTNHDWVVLR